MATLKDIADATGYSVALVSRALGERTAHLVGEEARMAVRQAAERLSYQPNRMASFMKRGLGPSLGFFLPLYNPELVQPLLRGLTEEANHEGFAYNLSFDISGESLLEFLTQTVRSKSVGIVTYLPADVNRSPIPPLLKRMTRQGTSVVVINSPLPPGIHLPHLDIDNVLGGRIAAEHLISTGCVRLFVEGSAISYQIGSRIRSFQGTADAAGVPCCHIHFGSKDSPSYLAPLPGFLDELVRGPHPAGLLTNDNHARLILNELTRLGKEKMLGHEIRLIGFNNQPFCQYTHPRLTTITSPMQELGTAAAHLLFNQILGGDRPVDLTLLQPRLVLRETA